jgi:hypothetical protein
MRRIMTVPCSARERTHSDIEQRVSSAVGPEIMREEANLRGDAFVVALSSYCYSQIWKRFSYFWEKEDLFRANCYGFCSLTLARTLHLDLRHTLTTGQFE